MFYQHPNLMRALGMHETVMEVMVNVLSGDSKVCTGGRELMANNTPMQKLSSHLVPTSAIRQKVQEH